MVLLVFTTVVAEAAPATCDEVVDLVAAGVSTDQVVRVIDALGETMTTADVACLEQAGVDKSIVSAAKRVRRPMPQRLELSTAVGTIANEGWTGQAGGAWRISRRWALEADGGLWGPATPGTLSSQGSFRLRLSPIERELGNAPMWLDVSAGAGVLDIEAQGLRPTLDMGVGMRAGNQLGVRLDVRQKTWLQPEGVPTGATSITGGVYFIP